MKKNTKIAIFIIIVIVIMFLFFRFFPPYNETEEYCVGGSGDSYGYGIEADCKNVLLYKNVSNRFHCIIMGGETRKSLLNINEYSCLKK